jgi:hypothetical protein
MHASRAAMSGKRPFANTPAFYTALGWFYAVWSRTELAIDCAIWKASGTETAERAHERAAHTKFSDKCKHLRTLLDGGKIPNYEKAQDLLTWIEDQSMRNVFAHSFLATDEHSVTFEAPHCRRSALSWCRSASFSTGS